MFSINKNSYLQSCYKEVNPRIINRSVQRALDYIQLDDHDLEPPFLRLTSEQPNIPVKNVDVTRRPVGFGRGAMVKLRRELHHKNIEVVLAAIESICDLVHDAEKGYEAIRLKIIDRMVDLISHENPAVRERTCRTLAVLATYADGREAITANKSLLANISICAEDINSEVRIQVAALLEKIARVWMAADVLIDMGFVTILLSSILSEEKPIVALHLQTMKSLMYGMKGINIAMECDGFNLFMSLLDDESEEIVSTALDCLSSLTSSCLGEKKAKEVNLLKKAMKFLYDERPAIHTNAAAVIMFCTVRTHGKITASQLPGLTKKLVELCKNRLNRSTQIFAIKALTNICEHPAIREEIKEKFLNDVNKIQVGEDSNIANYKKILLNVIGWSPEMSK